VSGAQEGVSTAELEEILAGLEAGDVRAFDPRVLRQAISELRAEVEQLRARAEPGAHHEDACVGVTMWPSEAGAGLPWSWRVTSHPDGRVLASGDARDQSAAWGAARRSMPTCTGADSTNALLSDGLEIVESLSAGHDVWCEAVRTHLGLILCDEKEGA